MTYLLALDQGTSSSRSIVFDREGHVVAMAQREFPQIYPRPGGPFGINGGFYYVRIAIDYCSIRRGKRGRGASPRPFFR